MGKLGPGLPSHSFELINVIDPFIEYLKASNKDSVFCIMYTDSEDNNKRHRFLLSFAASSFRNQFQVNYQTYGPSACQILNLLQRKLVLYSTSPFSAHIKGQRTIGNEEKRMID